MSPLALDKQNLPKVVTVLDTSLASSSATFAVHALTPDQTIFLKGIEIAAYLRNLESGDTKIQEIDFDALRAQAVAPTAAAPAPRDGGRIGGAVKIAIGVKKEVNFPDWYTSVCFQTFVCKIWFLTCGRC